MSQRTCFVVMGFNKKPDYATGRTLDLDKTYRTIIKPAVEGAGLRCIRADEIVHSGVIDVPMYQNLLSADVVVADISTSNPNALYELGVRHALRPFSTIVIAESQLKYPFDVNHTAIRTYVHSGDVIDYEETISFRDKLQKAILEIVEAGQKDSPVYTYLTRLQPPILAEEALTRAAAFSLEVETGRPPDPNLSVLVAQAESSMDKGEFAVAVGLLTAAHSLRPQETSIVQRLALATYKSKLPDPATALQRAREILRPLDPEHSTDAETLGLWAAVHKRLWEVDGDRAHLDVAIAALEKGFYLKNDHYNGINLAFLLNLRARDGALAEAVADFVTARRVRERVVEICRRKLDEQAKAIKDREPTDEEREAQYWVLASLAEACFGLDRIAEHDEAMARAAAVQTAPWMVASTREQIDKLAQLLAASPLRRLTADA